MLTRGTRTKQKTPGLQNPVEMTPSAAHEVHPKLALLMGTCGPPCASLRGCVKKEQFDPLAVLRPVMSISFGSEQEGAMENILHTFCWSLQGTRLEQ